MHYIRHLNQKRLSATVPLRMGIRGEIRAILRDYKGRLRFDSGWFDNLITDSGLESIGRKNGNAAYCYRCYVGSGTTPPSYSDAYVESPLGNTTVSGLSTPYEYYNWTELWEASANFARFNAGNGTGTINEICFAPQTQSTPTDGGGLVAIRHLTPVPIVKGATDILDVWYKPYWYFDVTDGTGTVDLDGQTYNWIARWFRLTGAPQDYNHGYTVNRNIGVAYNTGRYYSDGDLIAYNATGGFGGTTSSNNTYNTQLAAAGPGDHWVDVRVGMTVDAVLPSNTFRVVAFEGWATYIGIQVRFGRQGGGDEPVPFTDKDVFYVDQRWHYDRYTPDLFASPGSYILAGEDIATSVV